MRDGAVGMGIVARSLPLRASHNRSIVSRPPEAIRERLRLYDEQTEPLLEYYRSRGIVREVDGDQPIEAVTADLLRALRDGRE